MSFSPTHAQKSYLTIFGSCLIYLVMGNPYIWGGINIYAASYYKFNYEPDLNLDSTSVVFAVGSLFTPLGVLLSLRFSKQINYHIYFLVFGLFLVFSIFLSSYMVSFWLFVVFFSFMFGLGCGFFYVLLMINAFEYFPEKKGVISGILMSIYGLGGFLFTLLMTWIINPENKLPTQGPDGSNYFYDEEIYNKLPNALRILSYCYAGLFFTGYLCIFPYKSESKNEVESLLEQQTEANAQDLNVIRGNENYQCRSYTDLFKSKKLYFLIGMLYFSSQNGYFIASNYKNYGITKIPDDTFLSLVGSMSSLTNGGGRFIWGLILNKLNFAEAYVFLLILQTMLLIIVTFVVSIRGLYFTVVCLMLFCEGGHFVLFPTECVKRFGNDFGGKAYNFCMIMFFFSNITQYGLTVGVKEKLGYENEFWIFLFFTGISVLGLGIYWMEYYYRKKN